MRPKVDASIMSVIATNNGSTPVMLTPSLSSTDWHIVTGGIQTLGAGQSGTWTIQFAPTSAPGALQGYLNLARALGGTIKIALTGLCKAVPTVSYLTASGSKIYDELGNQVILRAVHWFGLEQGMVPGGLWCRPFRTITSGGVVYEGLMDEAKRLGFNSIRFSFCPDNTGVITDPAHLGGITYSPKANCKSTAWNGTFVRTDLNPDLFYPGTDLVASNQQPSSGQIYQVGIKTSLEVLDEIVNYAEAIDIRILLDMHSLYPDNDNVLGTYGKWYTTSTPNGGWPTTQDAMGSAPSRPARSEPQAIAAWVFLANRYKNRPTVAAFDIINEPYQCTWDRNSNLSGYNTSLVSYYERVEAAIRAVNTDVMLILEGVAGSNTYYSRTIINGDKNGCVDHTPASTGLSTGAASDLVTAQTQGLYRWGVGWASFLCLLATVDNMPAGTQVNAGMKIMPSFTVANKVIYSPHEYGTSAQTVGAPAWFNPAGAIDKIKGTGFYSSHNGVAYPANMPEVWRREWGYLAEQNIAPLLIGEFGGTFISTDVTYSKDVDWLNTLGAYCIAHDISYSYFCLNPNSELPGNCGGLLIGGGTWTLQQFKVDLLRTAGFLP